MSSENGLVNVFSLKSPAMPEESIRLSAGVSSVDFHKDFWQLLAVGLHDGWSTRNLFFSSSFAYLLEYRTGSMQ